MNTECPECNHRFQTIDVDGVMSERKLINEVLEESRENDKLRAENLRLRGALESIRDTSVAMVDSLRIYPKGPMMVIVSEGPARIRDKACDALYPAKGFVSPATDDFKRISAAAMLYIGERVANPADLIKVNPYSLAEHLQSHWGAAETADEKPDGQAENAIGEARADNAAPLPPKTL